MRLLLFLCLCLLMIPLSHAQDRTYEPRLEDLICNINQPNFTTPPKNVRCGQMIVPANRDNLDEGEVSIPFIIFESSSDNPAPDPIVYIIGGPGGATTPYPGFIFRPNFWRFLEERDFILFDGRGNGNSKPSLDCPAMLQHGYVTARQQLTPEESEAQARDVLLNCHDTYLEAGINPANYNTVANAADLADLRRALGYDEWNLFGVSYGTRVALTVMRDHPAGLRSVILDSNVPQEVQFWGEIASNMVDAFENLFTTCVTNETCNTRYPDLKPIFYAVVDQLNETPRLVSGRHTTQGFQFQGYVSGFDFAHGVFALLYDGGQPIPKMIYDVYEGDDTPLLTMLQTRLDSPFGISEGVYYSVHCHEEIPFMDAEAALRSADIMPDSIRDMIAPGITSMYILCDAWASGIADDLENVAVVVDEITEDIPILIVAGAFDPVSPPKWSQRVHQNLPHSYFYTYPTAGHGAINDEVCAAEMAHAFVNDPTHAPDDTCMQTLQVVFD